MTIHTRYTIKNNQKILKYKIVTNGKTFRIKELRSQEVKDNILEQNDFCANLFGYIKFRKNIENKSTKDERWYFLDKEGVGPSGGCPLEFKTKDIALNYIKKEFGESGIKMLEDVWFDC